MLSCSCIMWLICIIIDVIVKNYKYNINANISVLIKRISELDM